MGKSKRKVTKSQNRRKASHNSKTKRKASHNSKTRRKTKTRTKSRMKAKSRTRSKTKKRKTMRGGMDFRPPINEGYFYHDKRKEQQTFKDGDEFSEKDLEKIKTNLRTRDGHHLLQGNLDWLIVKISDDNYLIFEREGVKPYNIKEYTINGNDQQIPLFGKKTYKFNLYKDNTYIHEDQHKTIATFINKLMKSRMLYDDGLVKREWVNIGDDDITFKYAEPPPTILSSFLPLEAEAPKTINF